MSFNDSVVQGIADFDLLHRIMHGPANETVGTSGGQVPTIANVIAGLFSRVMASMSAVSTTALNLDMEGNKSFTVPQGKAFQPGNCVVAYAGNEKFIAGIVLSYTGTMLTIKPTLVNGEGSSNNWTIGFSGPVGPRGAAGLPGKDGKDATSTGTGGSVEKLISKLPWEV
jgi:hypothetical protein